MRTEFIAAVKANQNAFGVELSDAAIERLADYHDLIQEHNPILHLVGPCTTEEFATRHILESLTLLEYLAKSIWFADVGTGAGLPSIPCLLTREDLKAVLVESKEKKSKFLALAVEKLRLKHRTRLSATQFSETNLGHCKAVTCRALDKFTEKLPGLIKWSARSQMLLFGGENLEKALDEQRLRFAKKLMPMSERRSLFVVASGDKT
ncbi:MAG: 16S rRNA (guanine(527)-N(7))-methyltransferase RsmG [Pyrinomonadaceae bacterium]